jgi:hypothetical protein
MGVIGPVRDPLEQGAIVGGGLASVVLVVCVTRRLFRVSRCVLAHEDEASYEDWMGLAWAAASVQWVGVALVAILGEFGLIGVHRGNELLASVMIGDYGFFPSGGVTANFIAYLAYLFAACATAMSARRLHWNVVMVGEVRQMSTRVRRV